MSANLYIPTATTAQKPTVNSLAKFTSPSPLVNIDFSLSPTKFNALPINENSAPTTGTIAFITCHNP